MCIEERLVILQRPKEIGSNAHEHAQARVAETAGYYVREAVALVHLGAHIKFFALIDVEEECLRLRLLQLLVTALGRIQEIAKAELVVAQRLHPLRLSPCPKRVGRFELPG